MHQNCTFIKGDGRDDKSNWTAKELTQSRQTPPRSVVFRKDAIENVYEIGDNEEGSLLPVDKTLY